MLPIPAELLALGPWVVGLWLIFTFCDKVLFPLFVKHIWPMWSRAARERQAAATKAAEQQAAQLREAELERQRREDRVYGIVEANTRAMSGLQGAISGLEGAIEGVNDQLARQSESIHTLALDVSGLYGHLQVQRPSRRAAAAVKDKPAAGGS
jgi:ABC-type sulfate transport system permease subunit